MKICTKCKIEKELSDFYKNKQQLCGFSCWCKQCSNKSSKIYQQKHCKKLKLYHKNLRKKYKLEYKTRNKNYYLNNKKKILTAQEEYYQKHKENIKNRCKQYYNEHKTEYKEYFVKYNYQHKKKRSKNGKIYSKQRRKNDLCFKLLGNLRHRLNIAVKNGSKSERTKELLGCTVKFLKKHLELQFKDNMSWDNYGRKKDIKCWEIDHIKPCVSFDLSKNKEQRKCFHYSNLQPLWAKENRTKGGTK